MKRVLKNLRIKGLRIGLAACALLSCALILPACSSAPEQAPRIAAIEQFEDDVATLEATLMPESGAPEEYDPLFPLLIETSVSESGARKEYLPLVAGGTSSHAMAQINEGIAAGISELKKRSGVDENGVYTLHYEIKTNQRGLLSLALLLDAQAGKTGVLLIKPLTFEAQTGELITLDELFDDSLNWKGRLMDEVALLSDKLNIALSMDVPSITKNNEFYIADKLLVLVYQQYEISLKSDGYMQFPIPLYELEELLAGGVYERMAS